MMATPICITTFESATAAYCGFPYRCRHSCLMMSSNVGPGNVLLSHSQTLVSASCVASPRLISSRGIHTSSPLTCLALPPHDHESSSSGVGEPDSSRNLGEGLSGSEPRDVDEMGRPGNSNFNAFLPSRKQKAEADAKPKESAAKSALERAMAYKKKEGSGSSGNPSVTPSPVPPRNVPKVEILTGRPIQSSKASPSSLGLEPSQSPSAPQQQATNQFVEGVSSKESVASVRPEAEKGDVSAAALSAFEKAQAYRLQQAEMVAALNAKEGNESSADSRSVSPKDKEEANVVEVEIYTRDGIIKRRVTKHETAFANVRDIKRTVMSDLDFVGLGFSDKKSSTARPAGLSEAFAAPTGALPEVEIFTRDAGLASTVPVVEGEEADDVYKPRVTTWGVFPRPADISKAYGGGRNIKPGQILETEEEKLVREARTKKLLDDYRRKMGLDMDPKAKARCERAMKQGETLMDEGRLREALVAFENVMEKMPFPSELHGLAALQEAVCLDSLNRSGEAKVRYEKLVSHPNGAVRKKARQLLFGFQAAVKLKVRAGYNWDGSIYRKYFDSFADGYNTMYKANEEDMRDGSLLQSLPYSLILIFPFVLVFTLIALKNS